MMFRWSNLPSVLTSVSSCSRAFSSTLRSFTLFQATSMPTSSSKARYLVNRGPKTEARPTGSESGGQRRRGDGAQGAGVGTYTVLKLPLPSFSAYWGTGARARRQTGPPTPKSRQALGGREAAPSRRGPGAPQPRSAGDAPVRSACRATAPHIGRRPALAAAHFRARRRCPQCRPRPATRRTTPFTGRAALTADTTPSPVLQEALALRGHTTGWYAARHTRWHTPDPRDD
jgi:hypothetical protein